MDYTAQRYLAIAVSVLIGALTLITLADASVLGISPRASAWLAILTGTLGVLAGFLPSVRGKSRDPEFLLDRIAELPADERLDLATELAAKAERENRARQRTATLRTDAPSR